MEAPGGPPPRLVPPNLATDVPVSWADEIPDPREGDTRERWGYPIRIHVTEDCLLLHEHRQDVRLSPVEPGSGTEVPVQVVSDKASQHGDRQYRVKFLVLPRVVLEADTTYRLRGSWTLRGRRHQLDTWFETGRTHGQLRRRSWK